jgi:hypothetical protein
VTSEVSFEVNDTEGRASGSEVGYQGLRDINHEHSQVGAIVNGDGFDVHEILQAPELFCVPEVELDLETKAIVVNESVIGQVKITAEQNDVSSGLGFEIGFDDDDHIQGVSKELAQWVLTYAT